MIWQDRRALRTIRNGVAFIGAAVATQPLIQQIDPQVTAVAAASALVTLLGVWVALSLAIH